KEDVSHSHHRRRPKREEPSYVQRVPHESIEERRAKFQLSVLAPNQVEINLAESEQVKVVDQKCAEKNDRQPRDVRDQHDRLSEPAVYGPKDAADRAPLPEQQQQSCA